jgi:hypothetical protein
MATKPIVNTMYIGDDLIALPKNFDPKKWRAVRMWKELRDNGEFFFALLVRYYGPNDYGNKRKDFVHIGREIVWSYGKETDTDPDSPTFGKRVEIQPQLVTERIFNEKTKEWDEVKVPVNATKSYKYEHKTSDKKITEMYKGLCGTVPRSGYTTFTFISGQGSNLRRVETEEEFFEKSVKQIIEEDKKLLLETKTSTETSTIKK